MPLSKFFRSERWSFAMNFSYCPTMDRLGNELIEAYRLLNDQDDLWPIRTESPDPISAIHHRMTEHRKHCLFCRRIAAATTLPVADTGKDKPGTLRLH
jgi:hypothetical protein